MCHSFSDSNKTLDQCITVIWSPLDRHFERFFGPPCILRIRNVCELGNFTNRQLLKIHLEKYYVFFKVDSSRLSCRSSWPSRRQPSSRRLTLLISVINNNDPLFDRHIGVLIFSNNNCRLGWVARYFQAAFLIKISYIQTKYRKAEFCTNIFNTIR